MTNTRSIQKYIYIYIYLYTHTHTPYRKTKSRMEIAKIEPGVGEG